MYPTPAVHERFERSGVTIVLPATFGGWDGPLGYLTSIASHENFVDEYCENMAMIVLSTILPFVRSVPSHTQRLEDGTSQEAASAGSSERREQRAQEAASAGSRGASGKQGARSNAPWSRACGCHTRLPATRG